MRRTLILATTSYAGMGPYVVNIVNTFKNEDMAWFFLVETSGTYYYENINIDLRKKTYIFVEKDNRFHQMVNLLFYTKSNYYYNVINYCKKNHIEQVHFITGCFDKYLLLELQKNKIQIITTVHDLHPHEVKKVFYKEIRMKILYKRLFECFQLSDTIVTNEQSQYDEMLHIYNMKILFHEFPSLVTNSILSGDEIPVELLNINNYILFFGRIEAYKGVKILYDCFIQNKKLNKTHALVIAGNGDFGFERDKNEIQKNIIVINRYIKDSEVKYLYQHASCVVYPYISATQSGVLSLTFYFNVPCIASDIPFFKKIIEPSMTGFLFKAGDIEDLCRQLLKLLNVDVTSMKIAQKKYYKNYYINQSIRKLYI
jgi:glycosyltransferase involved in cell wall biosynthesis